MEEQHKAQVARVFDKFFTNGRYESIGQIYHSDCALHTNNKNYRLNEAVNERQGWRTPAPDLVMTADRMSAKGDIATLSCPAKGTHTAQGNGLRPTHPRPT